MSSKKFQKEAAAEFPPPLQTHAFKLVQSGLVILDKPVSFKKQRNTPYCRKCDKDVNHPADNGCRPAEKPSYNVNLKNSDKAPVKSAYNQQCQRKPIQHIFLPRSVFLQTPKTPCANTHLRFKIYYCF
jgi:hypothetical protein